MNIKSIIIFLFVLIFVEFCIYYYFMADFRSIFSVKKKNINMDNDDEIEDEDNSLVFPEEIWVKDELSEEEIKPLSFSNEEWNEDNFEVDMDSVNKLLFDIDPDFKVDQFFLSVFDLYSTIANYYSKDNLKEVANLMSKELYQENVRQLDYFRRRNLQHIVQVEDYINCQILDAKIIDHNLYVTVELKLDCYDYIINRSSQRVVRGIGNKSLYSVYHLILKRKITPIYFSKLDSNKSIVPSITNVSNLNDNNWILSANRITCRRSK